MARIAPKCEVCGNDIWPKQAWMHKDCVANIVSSALDVANKPPEHVANKSDRHTNKEKRRIYMREYMAKKRAKKL